MSPVRIVIVDSHAVVREGVKLLLDAQSDLQVVGSAGSVHDTLMLPASLAPDVLICETCLPDGNGIAALHCFRKHWPESRAVILTGRDDPAYLRPALAAGARGYIAKRADAAELYSAVRAVMQGRLFVDVRTGESLTGASITVSTRTPVALSAREASVLRLVASGHSHQQAADRLHLSVKTVETYRRRLGLKLGLKRRSDLVRYAIESGLLQEGLSDEPA